MNNNVFYYAQITCSAGKRHARRDLLNTGWHNANFRGFADYVQTPEFRPNQSLQY
jgi:hypothetical protein